MPDLIHDPFVTLAAHLAGFPTVNVEIGFKAKPKDPITSVVWTDITDRCRSFSTTRGRNHELAKFSPGTCQVVLNNFDRRFDPTNTASLYYPDIKPRRRIRISASWGPVTTRLFTGEIEAWPQSFDKSSIRSTVTIHAVDAFKTFNVPLNMTAYRDAVLADTPAAYLPLDDAPGATSALDVSGNGVHGTPNGNPEFGVTGPFAHEPGTAVRFGGVQWIETGSSIGIGTSSFAVECWAIGTQTSYLEGTNIIDPLISMYRTSATSEGFSFGIQANGRLVAATISSAGFTDAAVNSSVLVTDDRFHHVIMERDVPAQQMRIYIDGVLVAASHFGTTTNLGTWPIAIGAIRAFNDILYSDVRIAQVAIYTHTLGETRARAHYEAGTKPWSLQRSDERISAALTGAGWPAADRQLDTGMSTLRSIDPEQSVLTHILDVADTETGFVFIAGDGKVRFRNRYSSAASVGTYSETATHYSEMSPTYDDTDIWSTVVVDRAGKRQRVKDTAAETDYGKTLERTTLASTDAEARDQAVSLLSRFKDPILRIGSLPFTTGGFLPGETVMYSTVLPRELGDRVTVTHQPVNGGASWTQECTIEQISHSWEPPGGWRAVWYLAPYDTATGGTVRFADGTLLADGSYSGIY